MYPALDHITQPALLKILESTKCFRWLGGSPTHTERGETLLDACPGMELSTLPPVDYWLMDGDVPHYPYEKSWDEAKHAPGFVVHSKSIVLAQRPSWTSRLWKPTHRVALESSSPSLAPFSHISRQIYHR